MKTYTYEELRGFVEQRLATHQGVHYYHSRGSQSKQRHPFIMLKEPICYTPYWHGGPLAFQKGDYLHANPNDIYGLTAEAFNRCFILAEN